MNPLQSLLEEGVVDEVYQQLKTGKEAEVWLVSHRGVPVAAKVYKERDRRSFKNDADYREGRQVRSSRTQRAMDKGSRFGRQAAEEAWKSAEADALFALHGAGVRVPKPVLFYEGVLLMEAIADAEGRVAPRLVEAAIPREAAAGLYAQVRAELVKMLLADLIHGDMSEFNVLLAADGPVLIDFPQVVAAAKNSRAEHFFKRDLRNIWRFFTALDPALARHEGDADEIWRAYLRRELSEGFVPSGQPRGQRPGEQRGQHPRGEGRPRHGGGEAGPREDQRRGGPVVSFKGSTGQGAPGAGGGHHGSKGPAGQGAPGARGHHHGFKGSSPAGQGAPGGTHHGKGPAGQGAPGAGGAHHGFKGPGPAGQGAPGGGGPHHGSRGPAGQGAPGAGGPHHGKGPGGQGGPASTQPGARPPGASHRRRRRRHF